MDMADGELHDDLAGYALGLLEPDELAAFEAHLAVCERCRREAPGLGDAAAALAFAVAGPPPPERLRGSILAAARAERPNVVPLRPRSGRTTRALAAVAAAAAVAAVGLGVWAAVLSGSLADERSAAREQRVLVDVLGDPGARRVPLNGRPGQLVVAPDGRAALAVPGLPAAPEARTYEAWVIPPGGEPQPAGLFRGGGAHVLARPVPQGARVAVTVERAGGVEQPTSRPILAADA